MSLCGTCGVWDIEMVFLGCGAYQTDFHSFFLIKKNESRKNQGEIMVVEPVYDGLGFLSH